MYARQTTFIIKRDKNEEAVSIYKNKVVPEAEKQKGFKGALFLSNKNNSKFISLTLWESIDDAVENVKSGYFQAQLDKFDEIVVDTPEKEDFSVELRV